VINLAVDRKVGHIIQTNRGGVEREVLLAAKMMAADSAFIQNPLETIFGGPYSQLYKTNVFGSKQKPLIKDAIAQSLLTNRKLSPLRDPLLLIADELIMNSVFDAPKDQYGQFMHSNTPRGVEIILTQNESSEITVAHDDTYLVIMCSDPFGSLSTSQLLLRLQQCYNATGNIMNLGAGGAGVGCQMMFDRSCGFCIGVKAGVRTVFCCLLPMKYRNLAPELGSKNLHIMESV
jgi:hypothetical protein